MKHPLRLLPTLAIVALLLGSCSPSWSPGEAALINEAAYSRMRVLTISDKADSLLLRSECKPLTRRMLRSEEFGRLASSMIETVCDPENQGVGIAAPQVGIGVRMIAVQRFDKAGTPFEIYVNPSITARSSEMVTGGEGCLSIPDQRGDVERHKSIEIAYRDPVTFAPRSEKIEGFTAIIFQHEIDHLDGKLYTDYITK